MAKRKTEFKLDVHNADYLGGGIAIIGNAAEGEKPYVRIEIGAKKAYAFIEDKDLERFAVNILKALGSKKLKTVKYE